MLDGIQIQARGDAPFDELQIQIHGLVGKAVNKSDLTGKVASLDFTCRFGSMKSPRLAIRLTTLPLLLRSHPDVVGMVEDSTSDSVVGGEDDRMGMIMLLASSLRACTSL